MMPKQHLDDSDRTFLLALARQSIDHHLQGLRPPLLDKSSLSTVLKEPGASFVTLTINGYLRGCVGALEPYQSLAEDVKEHAVAAAFEDYRFPPVQANELDNIEIEISCLTQPEALEYDDPQDLIKKLRPAVDGVVIRDGSRRATFLPQVWEKIPDPAEFLHHLCMKMGVSADLWQRKKLGVFIYQVEEFHD
jgi:AmmeMemoRadiSam system protein A